MLVSSITLCSRERLKLFYVYMALCVLNIGPPIALTKLIRVQFRIEDFTGTSPFDNNNDKTMVSGPSQIDAGGSGGDANKSRPPLDEDARLLITIVNAFACTFFGSNFICFYNAFSMQVGLGDEKHFRDLLVPNLVFSFKVLLLPICKD